MQEHLGRPLAREEVVHHINGDRTDNRLENLELWTIGKKDPAGQRQVDRVKDLIEKLPPADQLQVYEWLKGRI